MGLTVTNALCNELDKDELKLQSKVLELSCGSSENSLLDNCSVSYELDDQKLSCEKSFDALIVTVSYLPMSVIITTFKKENVKRPLEGFGVLIPSKEQKNGFKTLDRAPNDAYLYITFVGESRNRELAKASGHYYWSKAFPLYGRNYGSVIEAIDKMEKDLPGLTTENHAQEVQGPAAKDPLPTRNTYKNVLLMHYGENNLDQGPTTFYYSLKCPF
ncbi:hypothetical protein ACJIZ3_023515 [Penstemon smallii]|uniref:Uncharacterized protein n=1 Tax=Penstemon smallii TaxID=265156 RepID=A0ABD3TPA7_9LAMI